MTITSPERRVTSKRIDTLIAAAAHNRLTDIGVAARQRLVDLLGDERDADRRINRHVREVENDPVYKVECDRLANPIVLAATNAMHLANQLAQYLALYADLPCRVVINLIQGDGQVIPDEGATSPVFITPMEPLYDVTWQTPQGERQMLRITSKTLKARLGKVLTCRAKLPPSHLSRVWDITVRDKTGRDVTTEVLDIDSDGAVPFAQAYVPLDATPVRVAAHLERLTQRYPHLWEGGFADGLGIFHYRQSPYLVEVQTTPDAALASIPLATAIHRINCAALGLPMTTPEEAVARLVRIAEQSGAGDRLALYQIATGEVTE
ncbi:hypothetical protein ACFMQL_20255 [Nonomuraea fastidiosa]|uniref:hypothetical protein n=1 Tax=Nonomuraea fastidiosa TaxID=46173 RepID=UPI00367242DD